MGSIVQEFSYTQAGQVKAVRYLDIGGKPFSPTKRGVAGWQCQYDAQGNRIQTTWINSAGTPVLNEYGDALYKQKYDADGNVVEEAYFAADGKRLPSCKDGNAGGGADLRPARKPDGRSYFGTDGKPCLRKDGYASWKARRTFDQRGYEISRSPRHGRQTRA